jgi:allantoinase
MVDVVIKGGRVVTPSTIFEGGIAVQGGKVVSIASDANLPPADRVIDAKGNWILPGTIDVHAHLLDLGWAANEDFDTGSKAAAAGGVTTVYEMPLNNPATTTLKAFEEKKEVASKKFVVDFGLYGGVVPGNLEEIPKLIEAGVVGFKAMMADSVPGTFEKVNDAELYEALKLISNYKTTVGVHAENDAIINYYASKLKAQGRVDPRAFLESRPLVSELEAVARALELAREANCPIHIFHLGIHEGADLIARRRKEGQKITAETCPHYLVLNSDDIERLGPYGKMAPPLRSKENNAKLWEDVAAGTIDIISSDHGPHLKENKEKGWKSIWDAGSGVIGIETMLSIILSEGVNKGRISINRLVEVLSANPAKVFGTYPQKGAIQLGADADVTIVDLNREHTVDSSKFHSKQKHSPYDGMKLKGLPVLTMVRGEVVAEDGVVVGRNGFGRFVPRSQ